MRVGSGGDEAWLIVHSHYPIVSPVGALYRSPPSTGSPALHRCASTGSPALHRRAYTQAALPYTGVPQQAARLQSVARTCSSDLHHRAGACTQEGMHTGEHAHRRAYTREAWSMVEVGALAMQSSVSAVGCCPLCHLGGQEGRWGGVRDDGVQEGARGAEGAMQEGQ